MSSLFKGKYEKEALFKEQYFAQKNTFACSPIEHILYNLLQQTTNGTYMSKGALPN